MEKEFDELVSKTKDILKKIDVKDIYSINAVAKPPPTVDFVYTLLAHIFAIKPEKTGIYPN